MLLSRRAPAPTCLAAPPSLCPCKPQRWPPPCSPAATRPTPTCTLATSPPTGGSRTSTHTSRVGRRVRQPPAAFGNLRWRKARPRAAAMHACKIARRTRMPVPHTHARACARARAHTHTHTHTNTHTHTYLRTCTHTHPASLWPRGGGEAPQERGLRLRALQGAPRRSAGHSGDQHARHARQGGCAQRGVCVRVRVHAGSCGLGGGVVVCVCVCGGMRGGGVVGVGFAAIFADLQIQGSG
jgi:hypothetical protein